MDHATFRDGLLRPEQHVLAAQELLLAGHVDVRAGCRAHTEALLAAATAVLQLNETLTSLGSLLAMHPVLAHALATRQLITDLEERAGQPDPNSSATAASARTQ